MIYCLECKTLSLKLDAEGRVVSLRHRGEDVELLAAGAPPVGLWQAGLCRPAAWSDPLPAIEAPELPHQGHETWTNRNEHTPDLELDSNGAPAPTIEQKGDTLRLVWTVPVPGGDVTATLTLTGGEHEEQITFHAEFTVPDGWCVQRASYPRIRGFGSLLQPEHDAILYPRNWGILRKNPLEDMTHFTGQYPSGDNWAQMVAWFQGRAGLYLGVLDPDSNHTGLDVHYVEGAEKSPWNTQRWHLVKETASWSDEWCPLAERVAAARKPSMQLRANHWPVQGQTWTSPYPTVLKGFTGGWYEASQIHRQWAIQQRWCRRGRLSERSDASPALAGLDLWFTKYGFHAAATQPEPAWKFRDAMRKLLEYFGMPFGVHWYHWHNFSWHTTFPRHSPVVEGFAEVKDELQSRGVVILPYCQGRLLYRDRPDIDQERAHACVERNGQPYLERYTAQDDWPLALCASDRWSQQQWFEAARMLWADYGVEGVYFDQITAMPPSLCYHTGHGHPLGGGNHYWKGYDQALAAMEPLKAEDPQRFLASESLSDAFMDRIDLYLSFVPPLEDYVPLFSAIYSGYMTAMGRSTPSAVLQDTQFFVICQGEQLLFGGQLGWTGDDILNYPEAASLLRDFARLRSRVRAVLHTAEMAPPLDVVVIGEYLDRVLPANVCAKTRPVRLQRQPIVHTVWRGADQRQLVLFLNESSSPAKVTFPLPAGTGKKWCLYRSGQDDSQEIDASTPQQTLELAGFQAAALVSTPESACVRVCECGRASASSSAFLHSPVRAVP